ncbi:YraN family protein [Candidatus Microgenomates bacterium]|nr:YraN family protein [Candidatus Microgenomates bacterium]
MHTNKIGLLGEKTAALFLQQNGYKILYKNYPTPFGEIDIIALESDSLVFVEVKTRSSVVFGEPHDAVNQKKLHKISKTAEIFSHNHPKLPLKQRIDVVSLVYQPSSASFAVELLKDVS